MKYITWSEDKNDWLKKVRGIGFEEVQPILEKKKTLDIVDNPNKKRYPGQKKFVIFVKNYVYLVPFVEDNEKIFLKTIIPSRKATKQYIERKK